MPHVDTPNMDYIYSDDMNAYYDNYLESESNEVEMSNTLDHKDERTNLEQIFTQKHDINTNKDTHDVFHHLISKLL